MKLMFVRHAEPDYKHDSLTLKGHREAQLLSLRLAKLDVRDFYASPLGRAQETARYTLERTHRTAETLPWLAEFRGRSIDPETGAERIPWDYKPRLWQGHPLLYDVNHWTEDELFRVGTVDAIWRETQAGMDALLSRYGMTREGHLYRCENNQHRPAGVGHAGIPVRSRNEADFVEYQRLSVADEPDAAGCFRAAGRGCLLPAGDEVAGWSR